MAIEDQMASQAVGKTENRRLRQKYETRDRVLRAAFELFSSQGYERTTIRQIAQRAGVALGSVFTTFSGKEELLLEIIYGDYETFASELRARKAALGGSVLDRITGLGAATFAYRYDQLRIVCEQIGASYTWSREMEAKSRAKLAPIHQLVHIVFEEGKATGEIAPDLDIEFAAEICLSIFLRCIAVAFHDNLTVEQFAERHRAQIVMVFRGFGPGAAGAGESA